MCGINIIINPGLTREDRETAVSRMTTAMSHRGPDDEGQWSNDIVTMGMRRLSIIGLSNGHQPFITSRSITICNGEIYNYKEIKEELISLGVIFKTESDCEVIPYLYEKFGLEGFKKLNGMFAFAIWDTKEQCLIIGRDRVGEKPLYVFNQEKTLIISSEINALLASGYVNPDLDHASISKTIDMNWPVGINETFLKKVDRVTAGEILVYGSNAELKERKQYWQLDYFKSSPLSFEEAKIETLHRLREAVRTRLQADVPVAILLSGGIDSSLIAVFARENNPNIHAITVGYEGTPDCDERPLARKLAKDFNLTLHEIELREEDLKTAFFELIPFLDEPIPDLATISQWAIYKKAKEMGFKVLLSGIGGDEIFYGYPSHNRAGYLVKNYLELFYQKPFHKKVINFLRHPIHSLRVIFEYDSEYAMKYPRSKKELNHSMIHRLNTYALQPDINPFIQKSPDAIRGFYHFLHASWLTNNCLGVADKLGMGNSVEVRCPLVDHNLVDFVNSLPLDYLFSLNQSKVFLRQCLSGILPEYILTAKKRGFTPPFHDLNFIKAESNFIKNANRSFATKLMDLVISRALRKNLE